MKILQAAIITMVITVIMGTEESQAVIIGEAVQGTSETEHNMQLMGMALAAIIETETIVILKATMEGEGTIAIIDLVCIKFICR